MSSISSSTSAVIIPAHQPEPPHSDGGGGGVEAEGATLFNNDLPTGNPVQDLPTIASSSDRSAVGAWGRRLMAQMPDNKFNLRNQLYQNLGAALQHVNDGQYNPENQQATLAIRTFARQVGIATPVNEANIYSHLQTVRTVVLDLGSKKLEKEDFLSTNRASSSRRAGSHAAAAPAANQHTEDECLSKGVRELTKQGRASTTQGKQIRQLLVSLGANPAAIGHTVSDSKFPSQGGG